jgi:PAS domain S-box-containing protein
VLHWQPSCDKLIASLSLVMSAPVHGFAAYATDLRDFVEDLNAIIWEADAQTHAFRWVSRHADEVLGYPIERWLHEPGFWEICIHPADRQSVLQTCREAVARGEDHQVTYRAEAADGRIVWLRDRVRVPPLPFH